MDVVLVGVLVQFGSCITTFPSHLYFTPDYGIHSKLSTIISIIQRTTASLVLYGVNFNTCMYVPQLIVFLEKKFFFFQFFYK